MRVRLKKAAEIAVDPPILRNWFPAGSEVEIPDDHFDPELHEDLAPPAPEASAPAAPTEASAASAPTDPASAAAPTTSV